MRALVPWVIPTLALALVPLWIQSPYALHIFILLFIAVALGESWNVIGGQCAPCPSHIALTLRRRRRPIRFAGGTHSLKAVA